MAMGKMLVLSGVVALLGVVGCGAGAQTVAGRGCGLDARNRYNMPLPVMAAGTMDGALAGKIRRGFELIYVEYEPQQAEAVLQPVLKQAVAAHNVCAEALADFGLGQIARSLHLGDALPFFRRADELLQKVGSPMALAHVHNRLALTESLLGDNAGFGRDEPAVAGEFDAAGDAAGAVMERSSFDAAAAGESRVEHQARLFRQLDAIRTPNVTEVRGAVALRWALFLVDEGRTADAMAKAREAVGYFKQCDCGPVTLAATYLQLGSMEALNDDPAAGLLYGLEADRLYVKLHLQAQRPSSLKIIGLAYDSKFDYAHAIEAYQQSLDIALQQKSVPQTVLATISLAQAYDRDQRAAEGIALLERVRVKDVTPVQECQYEGQLGFMYPDAGRYAEGEAASRHWLAVCAENFSPVEVGRQEASLAKDLQGEGRIEEAVKFAQSSVETVESERKKLPLTDRSLVAFQLQNRAQYDVLINALVAAGRAEDALLATEEWRGRPFLDLVSSGAPVEGMAQGRVVAAEVALPRASMTTRGGTAGVTAMEPTLRSEAHNFTLTSEDIRRAVESEKATMVSYFLSLDHLTIWVMSPSGKLAVKQLPVDYRVVAGLVQATLPSTAAGVRSRGAAVRTRGGESQRVQGSAPKAWRELYDLLIAPIEAELPREVGSRVIVVPEDALHLLSFAALTDAQGHYLVERYALSTTPAVGVLQLTAANEREAAKLAAKYVVVADPERLPQVGGHTLPALPGTDAEARGIARALPGTRPELLLGREAGIDGVVKALPSATVLHFATHAIVSDATPMSSFLALDTRQQGGELTAAAVYGMKMHASLVVLSACSTGRGSFSSDGVAGLGRAFFYAGSAALITTLWDVVDEPTAALMPKFYAGLAKGESRGTALREAQLAVIADLRAHKVRVKTLAGTTVALPESPVYWAAFSLAGQP